MKKPVQFFLRCDPDARFFYSVEFHPTQKSMIRAIETLQQEKMSKLERNSRAMCLRFRLKPEPGQPKGHEFLGTIYFVRGDADMSVVTHELTHAAVGWAKASKCNPLGKHFAYSKDPEEKFARTLQYMLEQFYLTAPRVLENAA